MNIPTALAEAIADRLEVDVRTDYSGRGMYGRTCFGFVGGPRDLVKFLLELSDLLDEFDEVDGDLEAWYDMSQDNMGYDTIYYWPLIHVVDEDDDQLDPDATLDVPPADFTSIDWSQR